MSKKQEVLEYLQTIPKGKVTTYKNIAKIFGIHPRAVAMYMKHNKLKNEFKKKVKDRKMIELKFLTEK